MQGIVLTDDDTGASFTCTASPTSFTSSNQMLASCGTTKWVPACALYELN